MTAVFIDSKGDTIERTKCEIYTRVMWYHRPVTSFNIWKKSEFYSRTYFQENDSNAEFSGQYTCNI